MRNAYTLGVGWAFFTLVREMFLACSRTLDFASTMEEVPTAGDLKRTRPFLTQQYVASAFLFAEKKERKETGSGRLV